MIGSGNGLSPVYHQAITWTNADLLSIGAFRTNFSEILTEIETFSFKEMHLEMLSAKWEPFCLSHNVLKANIQLKAMKLSAKQTAIDPPSSS